MKSKLMDLWKKCVNRETISYLICGVLTTIVNYSVDMVAYYVLNMSGTVANIIAWIVSVIFAFFANKIYVFHSNVWTGKAFIKELVSFTVARVLSLGFESAFIFVTVDTLKMENWIAKILSNVFVVIMNYFASKLFIFKNKKEDDNV